MMQARLSLLEGELRVLAHSDPSGCANGFHAFLNTKNGRVLLSSLLAREGRRHQGVADAAEGEGAGEVGEEGSGGRRAAAGGGVGGFQVRSPFIIVSAHFCPTPSPTASLTLAPRSLSMPPFHIPVPVLSPQPHPHIPFLQGSAAGRGPAADPVTGEPYFASWTAVKEAWDLLQVRRYLAPT